MPIWRGRAWMVPSKRHSPKVRTQPAASSFHLMCRPSFLRARPLWPGFARLALVEDQEFVGGDGSALHPLGVLNGGLTTVDVEGSTTNAISNTTSNAGSMPKIIDVEYALPSQYTANAKWLCRRSIEGKIRKL